VVRSSAFFGSCPNCKGEQAYRLGQVPSSCREPFFAATGSRRGPSFRGSKF
jgi:hypothetical protein